MFLVEVFWVVTPCNVVVRCQHFKGHITLKVEAAWTPKRWYPTTTLHGVTTQKTSTLHFLDILSEKKMETRTPVFSTRFFYTSSLRFCIPPFNCRCNSVV